MADAKERERAYQQLGSMVDYAATTIVRAKVLLSYLAKPEPRRIAKCVTRVFRKKKISCRIYRRL